jgi:hypothetical protein
MDPSAADWRFRQLLPNGRLRQLGRMETRYRVGGER